MQEELPKRVGFDFIIKTAFGYWRRTLLYQFLLTLMSFSILLIIAMHFGEKFGLMQEYINIINSHSGDIKGIQREVQRLAQSPEMENLSLILLGAKAFLFPLELGLFNLYRKIDNKEPYALSDLFAGYTGIGFFIFLGYYLFWYFVYSFTLPTIILPAVWMLCTLFVGPLMFFMRQPLFKAIGINLKVLRVYLIPICICMLVAMLFRYSGALLFGFGLLFTYPFSTAMIYTLYQMIFKEERRYSH